MSEKLGRIIMILAAAAAILLTGMIVAHHTHAAIFEAEQTAVSEQARAVEAELARDKFKDQAKQSMATSDAWRAKAQASLDNVASLETSLAKANARIKSLGSGPAPTQVSTIAADAQGLAAQYSEAGFAPIVISPAVQGACLAWDLNTSRPMLALLLDGKQYPAEAQRVEAAQNVIGILTEQKSGLEAATEQQAQEIMELRTTVDLDHAADAECTKEVEVQKVVIQAKDQIIKTEKPRKFTWGAIGVGIGYLIRLLL